MKNLNWSKDIIKYLIYKSQIKKITCIAYNQNCIVLKIYNKFPSMYKTIIKPVEKTNERPEQTFLRNKI